MKRRFEPVEPSMLRTVDDSLTLLLLVVATALAFDFTNGFHDTANAMATSIATGALPPRVAVLLSALLNVAGAFISLEVATTIAEGIVDSELITLEIISAALLGAILWDLITWSLGFPSSSSHALIGGLVGAMVAASGWSAVQWRGVVGDVVIPAFIAPALACAVAAAAAAVAIASARRAGREPARRGYRLGQIASASLVSLAHGTNDAQKTMGVIALALVAAGRLDGGETVDVPIWVILSAALAMGLGTYVGGWRIIRTLGRQITEVTPPRGFAAETSAGTVILAASFFGYPLSTTHVASGSILGSGAVGRRQGVRWDIAGNVFVAWLITLPVAACIAAVAVWLPGALGARSVAGPMVMTVVAIVGAYLLWRIAQRRPVTADNVNG